MNQLKNGDALDSCRNEGFAGLLPCLRFPGRHAPSCKTFHTPVRSRLYAVLALLPRSAALAQCSDAKLKLSSHLKEELPDR